MLKTFRSHLGGIFAKILIALLVLSFGLWGVGDMLRQGGQKTHIARVGDAEISVRAYQHELRLATEDMRARLGSNFSPELLYAFGMERQVLERLITRELFLAETHALGLIPNDATIARNIQQNTNFHDKNGKFDPKMFNAFLRQNGIAEKNYVELLRNQMAITLLTDAITAMAPVPQAEIAMLKSIRQERRVAEVYRLTATLIGQVPPPSEDALKAYYKEHAAEFSAPEYRSFSYVTFKAENAAAVKISNQLEDQLAGGATLDEAAKSLGLTVKQSGAIDRQGISADGKPVKDLPTAANFLEVAFKTEEGNDSTIGSLGGNERFLIHMQSVTPTQTKPLEEVKSAVLAGWSNAERNSLLRKLAEDTAKNFDAPESRNAEIKKLKLNAFSTGGILHEDEKTTSGIALPRALVDELFSLSSNQSTKAYQAADGSYMVAVLKSRIAAPDVAAKEEDKTLRPALEQEAKGELLQQYVAYLRKKYPVSIDGALLASLHKRGQEE